MPTSHIDGDVEIAKALRAAFEAAAIERGFTLMRSSVSRQTTWEFDELAEAAGDPVESISWQLRAEIRGKNVFGKILSLIHI